MGDKSNWALSREGICYSIRLKEGQTRIGRLNTCTIPITSPFCSRQHCNIFLNDGNATLQDCSSNGTFVNDHKVLNEKISLKANDRIGIGVFAVSPEELSTEFFHVYCLRNITLTENYCNADPKRISQQITNKGITLKSKAKVQTLNKNISINIRNIINPYNKIVTRSYMIKQRHKNL